MMTLGNSFAWAAQVAYTLCLMPQVFTNYRTKSGKGMSEFLLTGYLNLLCFSMFYVFLLDLPMAYKILVPIQLGCILTMIVQRLWYDDAPLAKKLGMFYLANLAVIFAAIPYAVSNPQVVGAIGGWSMVGCGVFSQAAQALTFWWNKSVEGFNPLFVYACITGGVIELTGAMLGGLPLQTKVSSLRVISFCLLFLWQLKIYAPGNVKSR